MRDMLDAICKLHLAAHEIFKKNNFYQWVESGVRLAWILLIRESGRHRDDE